MSDLHVNGPVIIADAVVPESTEDSKPGTIFKSASRAVAAYTSSPFFNPNARGVRLWVVNDGAGGSTATAKIQVQDPATGNWMDLAGASTAAVGAATAHLTVYPGLTGIADSAGITNNQHLGPRWRVVLTIAAATGTQSVGADYLL